MRIIDAFIVSDELEMLEFRLNYLNDHVDFFFAVDAPFTFQGKPKPTLSQLDTRKTLFLKEYQTKLMYFGLYRWENKPEYTTWDREYLQMNALYDRLPLVTKDDDIVMLSAIDEIPNASLLRSRTDIQFPAFFKADFFYYNINWVKTFKWPSTAVARVSDLKQSTAQNIRDRRGSLFPIEGGWHFSYFGGIQPIQKKLGTFSHEEYNKLPYIDKDYIQAHIDSGRDLFDRPGEDCVKFDRYDTLPPHLLENKLKYYWML